MTLLRNTLKNRVNPKSVGGQGWGRALACLIILFTSIALCSPVAAEPDPKLVAKLKRAAADAESFDNPYDAQVWLVAKDFHLAKLINNPERRLQLLTLIHSEASRAGLAPEIVLALIDVESGFDPYAVSSAGAQGIMQVMPFWKNEIGRPDDNLINLQTNLRYGCTILKHYLDLEQGQLANALARCNGSYGRSWYAELVLDAWAERWR